MKVTAIYPGTFDPITRGHVDIVARVSEMFDRVLFAIAHSVDAPVLFSTRERCAMASSILEPFGNVEVCRFDKLMTDCARERGATVIVRGIRAAADFDYEFQMAGMNRRLCPEAETIFLRPAEELSCISSTLVKEISSLGGDVSQFVHEEVLTAIKKKARTMSDEEIGM